MALNDTNGFTTNGSGNGHYNGRQKPERGYYAEGDPDEIDLKQLFFMLWGNKWIIIGVTILCMVLAWVFASMQTPIYKSEGSIMIRSANNRFSYAGSSIGNLLTNSFGIGIGSTVSNQLQILKSRRLSRLVADTLLEAPLMRNGRMYPVLFKSYPYDSTIVSKDSVAYRLRQRLTFTRANRKSNLIEIAFQSPSPLGAAAVVNLTIHEYNSLSTRQNRRSASSAVAFLNQQKEEIHRELKNSQRKLAHYRNTHQVVEIDAQTESLITRMADLQKLRHKAHSLLVMARTGVKQYKQQLNAIKPGLADKYTKAIGASMIRLEHALSELKTQKIMLIAKNPGILKRAEPPLQLKKVNRKIDLYKDTLSAKINDMLAKGNAHLIGSTGSNIAENIATLNRKLIKLKVQKQQYKSQYQALSSRINELKNRFQQLPENMIRLARLKLKMQINKKLYISVAKQQANMALWKQTQFSTGQVVDRGLVPDKPISPNKKLYLLVGFILGGILSIGYVFTREAFNTKIDGVKKLKEFGPPVLSVIPNLDHYIKKEHQGKETVEVRGKQVATTLVSALDSLSPAAESFRRLESNILHSNPDADINSIVITSSKQGEGKSMVAANLAAILAEAGRNVIIVDTDLRRPKDHKLFGLDRSPGVNEVLFNDVPLDDAVQDTVVPGLKMLTVGRKASNPSTIKKSKSFRNLIGQLKRRYDFVLLDSSPFGIISDNSSMFDEVGNIVLVSRFGETNKNELEHTIQELDQIGANIIGTVLNSYKHKKSKDRYYGQTYYQQQYYGGEKAYSED